MGAKAKTEGQISLDRATIDPRLDGQPFGTVRRFLVVSSSISTRRPPNPH